MIPTLPLRIFLYIYISFCMYSYSLQQDVHTVYRIFTWFTWYRSRTAKKVKFGRIRCSMSLQWILASGCVDKLGYLQNSKGNKDPSTVWLSMSISAMCTAPHAETCPPSPFSRFLLAQNLSSKRIAATDAAKVRRCSQALPKKWRGKAWYRFAHDIAVRRCWTNY